MDLNRRLEAIAARLAPGLAELRKRLHRSGGSYAPAHSTLTPVNTLNT